MTFKKTKQTYIRLERHGSYIYIINRKNQNKTKITDRKEAFLFWLAINGKHHFYNEKIKEWINKGYLEETKDEEIIFNKGIDEKPKNYTSKPLMSTIEITSLCNYKCNHCGNNSGSQNKNELTANEIMKIINQMERFGILKLTLTGGEPLLKKDFFKILKSAAEKIPRVGITSNGNLIDKKTSKRLKKYGVSVVKISLDGTEYFHDKNRGYKGAYKKAINAIKNLIDNKIEVRVQSTLMQENTEEILNIMPILSNLGVKVHSIVPISPIGRAQKSFMMSPLQYKKYILRINKKAKELNSKTYFEIRPVFGLDLKTNLEVLSTKYKCEAFKTTFEITSSGQVIPCSFLPIEIGDIRKNSLEEIWESKRVHKIRKLFNENLLKGKCIKCNFKKECGGGCIANSYALFNKHHIGDVYCWR